MSWLHSRTSLLRYTLCLDKKETQEIYGISCYVQKMLKRHHKGMTFPFRSSQGCKGSLAGEGCPPPRQWGDYGINYSKEFRQLSSEDRRNKVAKGQAILLTQLFGSTCKFGWLNEYQWGIPCLCGDLEEDSRQVLCGARLSFIQAWIEQMNGQIEHTQP